MARILDTWAAETVPHGLELYYSGAWHDVTVDLADIGVKIKRGRTGTGHADPQTMEVTLDNADGRYSPRTPTSPLFGLIARGTPIRYWTAAGGALLQVPQTAGAVCSTPDSASLSVTGDLDVRIDLELDDYRTQVDVLNKYGSSGQRSWNLILTAAGLLGLTISTNGSGASISTSTTPVPHQHGRIGLRATLDVNNGAGGRTVTFYYSETPGTSGPWLQLGDPVVTAGTVTLFDSTAPVAIGDTTSQGRFSGRVFAAEVRSGIAGTIVASPTFAGVTEGATSFVDGQGNTWSTTSTTISRKHTRFTGNVVSWSTTWTRKGAATVAIVCAGPRRRIGASGVPIRSTYFRGVTSTSAPIADLVAYWPMEDAGDGFASGLQGGQDIRTNGAIQYATSTAFDAAAPLPSLPDGCNGVGSVTNYAGAGDATAFVLVQVPSGGVASDQRLFTLGLAGGNLSRLELWVNSAGGMMVTATDSSGNQVYNPGFSAFAINGVAARVGLIIDRTGSDTNVKVSFLEAGTTSGLTNDQTLTGYYFTRITGILLAPSSALAGTVFGHFTIQSSVQSVFAFNDLLRAYAGEGATTRVLRLTGEEGLDLELVSEPSGTATALGPQKTGTILDVLAAAEDADDGILFESRGDDDLAYRSRLTLATQVPRLAITYTDNLLRPFEPDESDDQLVNRFTVTRDGGGERTHEVEDGPTGTAALGRYEGSARLSLYSETQTPGQASWRAHTGSVDESRWPRIGVELAHPTFRADADLTRSALLLDVGDRITVDNLPAWMPPDAVDQLVVGYSETVTPARYLLELVCVPARPHHIAIYDYAGTRYSGEGTVTAEALDTTETGVDVTCPSSLRWGHDDGDYDVMIDGEVMTVTGVSGTGTDQTLTVVRSVNGVVKSHASGVDVDLAEPAYYTL